MDGDDDGGFGGFMGMPGGASRMFSSGGMPGEFPSINNEASTSMQFPVRCCECLHQCTGIWAGAFSRYAVPPQVQSCPSSLECRECTLCDSCALMTNLSQMLT